jgi:NAD+ diphosphatase
VEVPAEFPAPDGYRFSEVRPLYGVLPDDEVAIAAFAVRITDFDRSSRFCGRCGAETCRHPSERAALCTRCSSVTYPRLSPAIIVLGKKGEEALLASSPRFPANLHSVIAGFVEPGENCEECVHREVREEVGIEVTNIRYFGSEPWPFPDSLMLGFVADYAGGKITIDRNEIASAGWFSRDNLPGLPSPVSISRALIDAWIRREI